ncbi:MAG: hypothetical protein GVY17_06015 [Cyanobacteria bacterium]|jgi:soluble cytochrome b562|nr:hypothetical protein [Cyanobacteria bacterium GSL.Bin21]
MILRTIKQIGLIIFCCGVIAFSSGFGLIPSAIAAPGPLAAMEDMADEAATQMEETAEDAQKSVEEGVEDATEKAKDAKETIENKAQEGMEKTKEAADKAASEAKEGGEGIIDKVKSLFTGE